MATNKPDAHISLEDCVDQAASNYACFLNVDPQKESQHLDEEIEEMLTKLDEFCAVVDMVRTDSSLALNRSLPDIHAKTQEMQTIFKKIDQLEEFVAVVRNNVTAFEELVNTAEKDLGTLNSIKSLFNSFPLFGPKKGSAPRPAKKFAPPEVFCTSDYISKRATPQKHTHIDSDR